MAGDVSHVENAKVAVYSCPFDASATETKGTVLIKSANELMQFSKGEEDLIEQVGEEEDLIRVYVKDYHKSYSFKW